ncbi:uncharacterized protein GGS25DRAFT_523780 [Hypoxylon fragiforme]|uniref:uncharacterized protein n=1 Tax=Hypoxylon fragiforme TaxID=63214 RepID=UPI0020C5DDD3|nr:uncharacterized protein GGS25DRAFT_523780 [Hypoxylon fragiforme]KAI2606114.1 hypothetical protein GGS25DRAFT_523780 [Hypoxylon fragiforme]
MTLSPAAAIKIGREKDPSSEMGEKSQTTKGDSSSTITESNEKKMEESNSPKTDSKSKKRSLFGFGKKKVDPKSTKPLPKSSGSSSPPSTKDVPQTSTKRSTTGSPIQPGSPIMTPSSPGRGFYSSSPRLCSPAGSQIFERDVQESAVAVPNSPAIPSHIQTENYIPPVLDASSEAITDEHLSPDSVEIVTHNMHQPASVTVTGASPYDTVSNSWTDDLAAFSDKEESASNYGSLDSSDVRRLSFISFADVVQAEQIPPSSSRDSIHLAGLTSIGSRGVNRSPSPIRSPVSSQGAETSPPNSISGSIKGLSMSPVRKPLGSPTSAEHNLSVNGDLNIETMSQALRRTGSTDLSIARSHPVSPIEGMSR